MSDTPPLVTIVTPSYNQGQFIRATIESVLTQDYPNIEYIIMDGASTDDTAAVAAGYADQLTFISEPDRGQSHAINKGLQMARGEIVAWLNSDDIFLPGAVRRGVEALERESGAGACYGEGYRIDVNGNVISKFESTQKFDLWRLLHLSDYILQQTVFFRRSVFDRVGWIDESLYYGMDWEILMRIGLQYPIQYIPEFMGAIREYPTAKTFAGGSKRVRELVSIMRRHTGAPVPSGAIIYGLPTYTRLWNERIAEVCPKALAPLGSKLQSVLNRVNRRISGLTMKYAQGLFSDGWASTRARFAFQPPRARHFELDVVLPPWVPFDRQKIRFRANGRVFAEERFEKGQFTIPVATPRASWTEPIHFTIESDRFFRPQRTPNSTRDRRKLCFLLRDINYSS